MRSYFSFTNHFHECVVRARSRETLISFLIKNETWKKMQFCFSREMRNFYFSKNVEKLIKKFFTNFCLIPAPLMTPCKALIIFDVTITRASWKSSFGFISRISIYVRFFINNIIIIFDVAFAIWNCSFNFSCWFRIYVKFFINKIFKSSPAAGPVVNFLLKNALAYGIYELRQDEMNWPFPSAPPIALDNVKFGVTLTF